MLVGSYEDPSTRKDRSGFTQKNGPHGETIVHVWTHLSYSALDVGPYVHSAPLKHYLPHKSTMNLW